MLLGLTSSTEDQHLLVYHHLFMAAVVALNSCCHTELVKGYFSIQVKNNAKFNCLINNL